ncbi:hypothetical protein GCM10008967_33630 [Bacillus carboniphilus]|uniref:VOC domain-containing protein n=1 Tax=Bacillus carboniphilus TaxID=86663 RepID=A0ABP3GAE4_9BACI
MKWHHVGIEVKNISESIRFYQNYFGLEIEEELEWEDETVIFMGKGPVRIELIQVHNEIVTSVQDSSVHFSWEVETISGWIDTLGGKGLIPVEGPIKLENGWQTVFYEGPTQEVIELIQR